MNSRRTYVAVPCTLLVCSLPSLAAAEQPSGRDRPGAPIPATSPAARFGLRHELAISSDTGLSISNTSISGQNGSTTTLQFRPAIDYFVVDDLSLGAFVGVDYTRSPPGDHTTALLIGPRVGYNIALANRLSFWPKAGLSYAHTAGTVEGPGVTLPGGAVQRVTTSSTNDAMALNLYTPFVFHPVQHFFLGVGPALDVDLTGSVKATTVAARLTIGGWL